MKKTPVVRLFLALILFWASVGPSSAQSAPSSPPRSERQLLDILRSSAGLQERDAACAELKRAGTALCVPVLADLLADEQLSHTARYVLETLPAPEAGRALTAALDKTTGSTRVGIIDSLGRRREGGATGPLVELLASADANEAGAAAGALGRIGGQTAIDSLRAALPRAGRAELRNAVLEALLVSAQREAAEGRSGAAFAVFAGIRDASVPDHVRGAAYRGMIASADEGRALKLVISAIRATDGPEQLAALEMARSIKSPGTTRALCESLGLVQPPVQVALIEALRQRVDPSAGPSLLAASKSPVSAVRIAALSGLGELGDQTAVPILLEAAGSSDDVAVRTARQALLVLRRGDVAGALTARLSVGRPATIVEAARALAGRGDHEAVGSLTAVVGQNTGPARAAACLALGQLADAGDLAGLVGLVVSAGDDAGREQARDALGAACLRLKNTGVSVDATPIVAGLASASPEARGALLQAGSPLSDERLRAALRSALSDKDQTLRAAAQHSLSETRDPALLPDLMSLARESSDLSRRVVAVRSYIRLVADEDSVKLGSAERVKALAEILPLARAEERWAALACLARIPDTTALELALPMLDDPATRAEAAQAVTAIATRVLSSHPEHARMGLEKVLAACSDPDQRAAALFPLSMMDLNAGKESPVRFRHIVIDPAFRSEGLAVADFNKDGKLDIATGNILYLGPDWKPVPMLGAAKTYDPDNYSNEFLCFAEDIDHDGWLDLIVVGFPEAQTRWLRNPGRAGGPWKEFLAIEKTGNESPDWVDVDQDGRKELVFAAVDGLAFARPGVDPSKPWPIRVIAGPGDPRPGHGLGIGDVNGDGRPDVICPDGWWESPAARGRVPWTFHRAKLGFDTPAQMPVFDVDGDGDADIFSSAAHRYGLWWYEQTAEGWKPHEIDHAISQLHALHLADINRDGLPDIVTGKRFWAHKHNDEGIDDPVVLCWFEMKRDGGKPSWIRHDIDFASGVGLHVQIVDINGDGLLDIATSSKKGVHLFIQEKNH